jgi:Na+/H+ antiporter NhaD/arsenite permease-like protein
MGEVGIKIAALAVFLAAYVLIVVFYRRKILVVWAAVGLLLALRVLEPLEAWHALDWNVLLLYLGMLLVSEVFLLSRMPDFLATLLAGRSRRSATAMLLLCLLAGFLSIALENVAVVLLVSPVALSIARRCRLNPVPLLVGLAVSSNLQGAATLIGDPPSMLLAGYAGLSFNDFFVFAARPGIFFAVQIGAAASALVLWLFFRRHDSEMPAISHERYESLVPTILVLLLVTSLIVASSFQHGVLLLPGLLCCAFGLLSFGWLVLNRRGTGLREFAGRLDWQTGVFLAGIFVLVESLSAVGFLEDAARWIAAVSGRNAFLAFQLTVWLSVGLSAFVDNVPYLMAMLPVVGHLAGSVAINPYVLYVALLVGASVGGNVTPIGASANIVAMGLLKKAGHAPRFFDFVRIGLPFTLVAVTASSLFVWVLFRGAVP